MGYIERERTAQQFCLYIVLETTNFVFVFVFFFLIELLGG